MSRLHGRLRRLERALGDCPACAERGRAVLALGRDDPEPDAATRERCTFCGTAIEPLFVRLHFVPHLLRHGEEAA